MAIILSSVVMFYMWIEYWIQRNKLQLPQRTSNIVLRIFKISFWCFALMIIGLSISPIVYWTPILRIYGYGLMLIFASIKIVLANILFLQFLISKVRFTNKISSPKRWFQVGLCVVVFMFTMALYGSIYEVFNLKVNQLEVRDKAVPKAFDDYRIVQFSDMHIGSQVSKRYVRKLVDSINAQNPDLVVFTGDMVNFYTNEIVPFVELFSQIRAKDGVFVVLGNHDYSGYLRWKTSQDSVDNILQLINIYHSMGWNVLQNEHIWLHRGDDSIALAGVENYSSKRTKRWVNIADTEKALKGISPSNLIVMISHNPQHFNEELQINFPHVNLTLTGHSHGGQMAIGEFSVARLAMKHWRGFHQFEDQYLNVCTGCGFNALPFRINMSPNISVVTLSEP
ncbi:MAG: metallophosphoesterase [Bacteroidales bacterium]|nr:metallophosphoesterase [Bacteroidales bacterium]